MAQGPSASGLLLVFNFHFFHCLTAVCLLLSIKTNNNNNNNSNIVKRNTGTHFSISEMYLV